MDVIEAGFAASSPGDFEGVRAVAQAVKNVTVASLCRTNPTDIDASAAALEDAPRSRAHIFLATSELHMAKKLRMTPEQVVANAKSSVTQAAATMDEVEFSCEDATRSDPEFVAEGVPDGDRGRGDDDQPARHRRLLPAVGVHRLPPQRPPAAAPSSSDVVFSAHCHDDLGLAVANSLAALDAGVAAARGARSTASASAPATPRSRRS